jgi:ABC-2 type transport system permease protein
MALITPLIWLILFGQAFNIDRLMVPGAGADMVDLREVFGGATNYFSFMAVGQMAVIILFTSFFGGASLVWDRKFGFLAKLQVAPISRIVIPVSRIGSSVIRTMFQAIIVLGIAVLFVYIPGLTGLTVGDGFGALDLLGLVIVFALLSIGFAAIFVSIGLLVTNQDVLYALINLANLPLMFTSNALIPISLMPDWLASIARYNPITFAVDAARQMIFQTSSGSLYSIPVDLLGLFIFAGLMVTLGAVITKRALVRK